jgi:uncharacterized protein
VHDFPALLKEILRGYALPLWGDHGVAHWGRVYQNGLRLAELTGADQELVALFAVFHDSRRINEDRDYDHGLRGGEFARSLRGTLIHLDDARFELLHEACRLHTVARTTSDPTLGACWDADRLDLGRVGLVPTPKRLCSASARELLTWAHERAVAKHIPRKELVRWGVLV